jgi:hypothetical protein
MSQTVQTEILLPASPDRVWAVLADFPAYPQWNPFVRQIDGKAEAGASLCIRLAPKLGWTVRFCASIVAWQPGKAFAWAGGPACLLHGRHFFELQASEDGQSTRLVHGEIFSGLFARPLIWMLGKDPAYGYRAMNDALRLRLSALPDAA